MSVIRADIYSKTKLRLLYVAYLLKSNACLENQRQFGTCSEHVHRWKYMYLVALSIHIIFDIISIEFEQWDLWYHRQWDYHYYRLESSSYSPVLSTLSYEVMPFVADLLCYTIITVYPSLTAGYFVLTDWHWLEQRSCFVSVYADLVTCVT